jgi:hypothetical protein
LPVINYLKNFLIRKDLKKEFILKIFSLSQLLLECETIAQTQNFHYQYLERTDSITKTHTEKGLDILKAVQDVESVFSQSVYAHKKKS